MPQFDAYSYSIQVISLLVNFWALYFIMLTYSVVPGFTSLKLNRALFLRSSKNKNGVSKKRLC